MQTKRLSDRLLEALTAYLEKIFKTYDWHSSKPFVSFNQASSAKELKRRTLQIPSGSRVLGTLHIIKTWHLRNPIQRCGKHSTQASPVKQKMRNVLVFSSENTVRHITFPLGACVIKRSGEFMFLCVTKWQMKREPHERGRKAAIHGPCNTVLPLVWQWCCPKSKEQRHLRCLLSLLGPFWVSDLDNEDIMGKWGYFGRSSLLQRAVWGLGLLLFSDMMLEFGCSIWTHGLKLCWYWLK